MAAGFGPREGGYGGQGDPPQQRPFGGYSQQYPEQQYSQQQPRSTQWASQQQMPDGAPQPLPQRAPQRGGGLREMFAAGDTNGTGRLADRELCAALASAGVNFSIECCRLLLTMHHSRGFDQEVHFEEFVQLHNYIERSRKIFQKLGPDERGVLGPKEVHNATTLSGYWLSRECFAALIKRFDRWGHGGLALDGYIELSAFLHNVKDTFAFYDQKRTGEVLFNFDGFTTAAAHLHGA